MVVVFPAPFTPVINQIFNVSFLEQSSKWRFVVGLVEHISEDLFEVGDRFVAAAAELQLCSIINIIGLLSLQLAAAMSLSRLPLGFSGP